MKKRIMAMTVLMAAGSVFANNAYNWSGGGDGTTLEDINNWAITADATTKSDFFIDATATTTLSSNFDTVPTTDSNPVKLQLGTTGGTDTIGLTMASGADMSGTSLTLNRNGSHTVSVDFQTGSLFDGGGFLEVGHGGSDGGSATATVNGGTINSARALSVGFGSAVSTFTVNSGSAAFTHGGGGSAGSSIGANGTIELIGGELAFTRNGINGILAVTAGGAMNMEKGLLTLVGADESTEIDTWLSSFLSYDNGNVQDYGITTLGLDAGQHTAAFVEQSGGYAFYVDYNNVAAGDTVAWVEAIPEPATLGLIAAFGGGLLFIRRRFMV